MRIHAKGDCRERKRRERDDEEATFSLPHASPKKQLLFFYIVRVR